MNNEFSLNTVVWFLTAFFLLLKLSGQVDWSWVWVLSPLWVTASVILLATVIILFSVLLKVVSMKDLEKFIEEEEKEN